MNLWLESELSRYFYGNNFYFLSLNKDSWVQSMEGKKEKCYYFLVISKSSFDKILSQK